ncbi:MAG: Gldg family protein [Candidatus Sumerlaeaceae bacterium]
MNYQKTVTFIGLVLLLTGLVVTGLFGRFTTVSTVLCLAGMAAGSFLFLPRVTRNRWLYLNMALYSVLVCSTLLVFYFILLRHPAVYDATSGKLFSLSPITKNFLSRVQEPVHAVAFYGDKAERTENALILGQYARYAPQFTYDIFNPFSDVAETRRFGLNVSPGDIYLEKLTTGSKQVARTIKVSKAAEEDITNGIVQLLRGSDVTIYFLTGHGEPELEEDKVAKAMGQASQQQNDLFWLKEQLQRSYIKVLPLSLGHRGRVPSDASAVVIAAPRMDLTVNEREALLSYLDKGGRAMFMLNPDIPQLGKQIQTSLTNCSAILERYGILSPPEIVVMPLQPSKGGGDIYTVTATAKPHSITRLQGNNTLVFGQARPLALSKAIPENTFLETLLVSGPQGWRIPVEEFAKAILGGEKISIGANVKDLAPQTLAVAATHNTPGKGDENATRIVAIGNGNFVTSRYVDQNSWLFFLNAINWMTNSADLIAIPSSRIENTPVVISDEQARFLFILLVIAIPALIGLGGLGYTISRRGNLGV